MRETMVRSFARGSVLLGVLLLAQAADALTVTLDPGGWSTNLTDRALVGLSSPTESTIFPASFPESATTPGATQGDSSAVIDYSLSNAGFDIIFDQTVAQPVGSGSQGTAYIYFSVDQDTAYEIVGSYNVSDTEGRGVYFRTYLQDITGAPTMLFESSQYSNHTPDESFTAGLLEGDTSNLLSGAPTGTLIAGRTYRFYADAALESYPDVLRTTTASGTGNLALIFVPEPSSALLVGLGLAVMGALRRRS
jgi:hypothetical protein